MLLLPRAAAVEAIWKHGVGFCDFELAAESSGLDFAASLYAEMARQLAVEAELSAQESRAKFYDQLFTRVNPRAKAVLQIPIKSTPMTRPMALMPISA
jgi:hypothetical protein